MIFKKASSSLGSNTRGSVGTEQILTVAVVGLLGLGGFTLLGGGMHNAISGNAGGAAVTPASGPMAVSAAAGTANGSNYVCADGSKPTSSLCPDGKTYRATAKLPFGHVRYGDGEGFFSGLLRTVSGRPGGMDWLTLGHGTGVGDQLRGVLTLPRDVFDAVLPDVIMNPIDDVLGGIANGIDWIAPGHGFLGDKGFFSWAKSSVHDVFSGIGDFFGWNDDVHAKAELKKFKAAGTYKLTAWNNSAIASRLNDIQGNVLENPNASPEQIAAALQSINEMLEGDATDGLKTLVDALRSRGADEAAEVLEKQIHILNDELQRAIRLEKKLLAVQKTLSREPNPVIADAMHAVNDARVFAAVAKKQGKKMPKEATAAAYKSLDTAQHALAEQIENYDIALTDDMDETTRTRLTKERAYLAHILDTVGRYTEILFAQSSDNAIAAVTPAEVVLGEAQVLEQGGVQTTRGK